MTATYSLVNNNSSGAKLCLKMTANLLTGERKATPIALAQHSYFNLSSHSSPNRILDHSLHLPNCSKFTPLDNTSIPTRKIQQVKNDDGAMNAMDFCSKAKPLSNALIQYGEQRAGLNQNDANNNIQRILNGNDAAASTIVARVPKEDGVPYGFDHNYVIDNDDGQLEKKSTRLRVAAILYHSPTGRALRVLTSSPGMQLYTSNHLDGKTPTSTLCKDNTSYPQWQGICLETQTFPDSIYPHDKHIDVEDDEFAQGRCFILRPGGANYHHDVEYEFLNMNAI